MEKVKNVRVGSMNYEIGRSLNPLFLEGRKCKSTIDYDFHIIELNAATQDAQAQEQALLREIIYAIIRERNVDINNTNSDDLIYETAIGLHQVILDNPDLFKPKKEIEFYSDSGIIKEM